MSFRWTSLLIADDAWTLGLTEGVATRLLRVEVNGSDPARRLAAVHGALRDQEFKVAEAGTLIIGLPSSWCFAATVSTNGLLRRQRRSGLLYRLEEKLPVDAEAVTADFLETNGEAFGVATLSDRVRPVLEALEAAGLTVAHMSPTALLAAASLRVRKRGREGGADSGKVNVTLLAPTKGHVDLVVEQGGSMIAWRQVGSAPEALAEELRSLDVDEAVDVRIRSVGLNAEALEAIGEAGWNVIGSDEITADADPLILAATHAGKLLRRGQAPAPDLKRDALAGRGHWSRVRPAVLSVAAAATLLLLSVASINLWQARGHQRTVASLQDRQSMLFRETFPDQRVPAAILARFRSEAAKSRGLAGTDASVPPPATTLQDLHDVLTGLPNASEPDALRFRVLELRVEPTRLYLDGQARSHADADRIAAGLRGATSYQIDPPRTQNLRNPPGSVNSANVTRAAARPAGGGGSAVNGGVNWTLVGQRSGGTP